MFGFDLFLHFFVVSPTFIANPKDKVRMVGHGVVLCCKAEGQPEPLKYTW